MFGKFENTHTLATNIKEYNNNIIMNVERRQMVMTWTSILRTLEKQYELCSSHLAQLEDRVESAEQSIVDKTERQKTELRRTEIRNNE
jgi:hypothetical protein